MREVQWLEGFDGGKDWAREQVGSKRYGLELGERVYRISSYILYFFFFWYDKICLWILLKISFFLIKRIGNITKDLVIRHVDTGLFQPTYSMELPMVWQTQISLLRRIMGQAHSYSINHKKSNMKVLSCLFSNLKMLWRFVTSPFVTYGWLQPSINLKIWTLKKKKKKKINGI